MYNATQNVNINIDNHNPVNSVEPNNHQTTSVLE